LRALAGIVSEYRADVPPDGLPMSLLAEIKDQIPCDDLSFEGFDSVSHKPWFIQEIPGGACCGPAARRAALGALLGLSALQSPRPHRRPAHGHQDR